MFILCTVEGVLTCVASVPCYFLVPDFPENSAWLSQDEKLILREKLREDGGHADPLEPRTIKRVLRLVMDCTYAFFSILQFFSLLTLSDKFILSGFMFFGLMVSAYSICK